ncbi:immunoglobulin lambda-1 light chain-like [Xiphophorus couchianus]|uniref:immunoglobulin lambda-1 light chain-like n=1 Tax=Xiphophorus couchianus TaxID=32473 RepID=UPI001015E0C5|nr:immunoglobulin lambda-1 light chain-like [Xiphophorus couchianus]
MGALVPLLETTWPWSDLSARPCLASAASERHFSPGSPEETPLHTMLFLPAAALCWLGSALAAMATHLVQDHLTLTRRTGQSVSFSCGGTGQCGSGYIYWYQKKETETFRVILYIYSGGTGKPYNHPQQDDFSAERDENSCKLKINKVKLDHSASYYCGCWKSGSHKYLFGSGTKLFVTGRTMKKPEVTVCPVKTQGRVEGETALMCLASAMYPPLVRISWKRQKGSKEEPAPAEEKQQELSGSKSSAVIRLVKNETLYNYEYICEVQHEGGSVTNQTRFQELPEPPAPTRSGAATDRPAAPAPPPAASVRPQLPVRLPVRLPVSFQSRCRVKLLCLLYSVLIVKSLVYCSGLSVLMVLRSKGPAPS